MLVERKASLCFLSVLKTLRLVLLRLKICLRSLDHCSGPFNVALSLSRGYNRYCAKRLYHLRNMLLMYSQKCRDEYYLHKEERARSSKVSPVEHQYILLWKDAIISFNFSSSEKIWYPNKSISHNSNIE